MKNPEGISLSVRLVPGADRDSVYDCEQGSDGEILKARVRAVPEKGKANTALVKLISDWLDVPKSDIKLVSGSKSRIKILRISGDEPELSAKFSKAIQELKQENAGQ